MRTCVMAAIVLCVFATSFATITFSSNTLTYSSPSDLGTTVDPSGQKDVTNSYGITKASFQALNPKVVAFNGAPTASQTLRTLVVNYTASSTVTFTFPTAMYNYGSATSVGRGSFSGSAAQDAISTVPTQPDTLYDWFDASITSTGGQGVQSLGFCAAFRNDQAVSAGQVLFTLSDSTTGTVTLPALGAGNPEYVFIGYTAPTGKTITRVQASRTSGAGGGYVSVDDLSFVMSADTTAPAAVANLSSSGATASSVTLTWTAPGDDGSTGTATTYDIRYSTSTITAGNWASATQVTGEPTPAAAGTGQNMTVSGLSADTTYYFAIETADEVPNWSSLSNVYSRKTSDTVAPAAVANLATSSPTASSIVLSWTAPGDNGSTGTATTYDIRYSTSTITAGNWASATQVTGEPTPAVAGTNQNMTITGLSADTTYYFAIETADEVPNWSTISNVPSGKTSDTVAPAAVANLATSSPTGTSITVSWTAPGDNGSTGTATTYDIRYSTSTITAGNWASATQVSGEPTPAVAGTNQNMTVSGLTSDTTYYFAIETADEVPNWSTISNVPSGKTSDVTAPAAVANLATSSPTSSSITLSWTAPGDSGSTGTATTYDIRYSTSTITSGNWASATQVTGEPAPAVAGTNQNMVVSGLSASTTYYFAIETADEVPNWSSLSNVPSGTTTSSGSGTGLKGDYYDNSDFTNLVLTRTDATVDFDWGTGSPDPSIGYDSFSIRWTGQVQPQYTETYTFYTWSDDGVRLWVNSQLLIDDWTIHAPWEDSATIALTAGVKYDIKMEYYDNNGGAMAKLSWSSASTPKAIIPQTRLFASVPDTTAPAAVTNLATGSPTTSSITLTWTAPGDDGSTGTATTYDIRYSTSTITAGNFASATQATGAPAPQVAGTNQSVTVSGLSAGTTYYFAMKAADEASNWSAISNVPSGATSSAGAIVALKRDTGLTAGGATDSRFNTATVRTVTVADAAIYGVGDARWTNAGNISYSTWASYLLYRFDLSSIPANATINLAQLRLYHASGNSASGNGGVSMILTHAWTEGTGNSDGYTYPGSAGGVSSAHPSGRNTGPYQDSNGTTSGPQSDWGPSSDSFFSSADFGTAQDPFSAPTGAGYNVIDVTSHVQQWVNGTANYGWAQSPGNWVCQMSEAGSANEPVLFIDYGAAAGDTTAPAAVTNLATSSPTSGTMTLTWTAPGDDNTTGTATTYDVRYSTSTINAGNWASATQVTGEPTPVAAGTNQYMTVSGLSSNTTYYFAIKTADEVPNWSAISNVASGTTSAAGGGGKALLTPKDFKYKGYYEVQRGGAMADLNYGQSLTHRYVNGELRFLTLSFFGNSVPGHYQLIEFAKPANFGSQYPVTSPTGHWVYIGPTINGSPDLEGRFVGLWYEQAQERLWTTYAVTYPQNDWDTNTTESIAVRTLNSDGTISNLAGPWSLPVKRRNYGGMQAVPAWFQSTYNVAPYATGWGGEASMMSVGPVSTGPTMYTFRDPTVYPPLNNMISDYMTLMDHSAASTVGDWYANGVPTTYDRGIRNCDVSNEFEFGQWLSPAPDGLGRWAWGDSNFNTGCWIETSTKQGFILVPQLQSGRVWYYNSVGYCERKQGEIQVFDPAMLGQVALGTRATWNTNPTYRWQITDDMLPLGLGGAGTYQIGAPSGATYDSTTQTLYVYATWGNNMSSYILAYEVGNGNASVKDVAASETHVAGTVSGYSSIVINQGGETTVSGLPGNRANTETCDSVYETITEVVTGGTSQLEQQYLFNVTGGSSVTFNVKAYHTSNSEGDDFVFAYSTNGTTWTNMVTVTKTADDGNFQSYTMPANTQGTVYVRVRDADRTAGRNNLDTIYVDEMNFTSNP